MPTYEYQCTACDHRFDIWQQVGEAAPECPNCGGTVKKVFHPPRVHFKGSGFYVTDLRAEKEKSSTAATAAAKTDGAETSTKSESSSPSGDTKPATETTTSTESPKEAGQ